ncbi:MAG TPA: carboxylating nicotinate-nucleotide diphosphorylase [bacterium]|nr:carboxylating nicotinate-nucleotide diphosphorylase [bacterium]
MYIMQTDYILLALLEDLYPEEEAAVLYRSFVHDTSWYAQGLIAHQPDMLDRDVTGAVFSSALSGSFDLIAREEGVISGLSVVEQVFHLISPQIHFEPHARDGDQVQQGTIICTLHGSVPCILLGERTALNFLCHLSGVASRTRRFVELVAGTGARILDTRKTIPGLRALQKAAVVHGGGMNHRFGLYDMVLIKNNHVDAAGGVREAIQRVRARWGEQFQIVVEVRDEAEVRAAVELMPTRIMLDNFAISAMREAVAAVAGRVPLEASGNVTMDSVRAIAETRVDFVSIGGDLTLSAPRLDFSLHVR